MHSCEYCIVCMIKNEKPSTPVTKCIDIKIIISISKRMYIKIKNFCMSSIPRYQYLNWALDFADCGIYVSKSCSELLLYGIFRRVFSVEAKYWYLYTVLVMKLPGKNVLSLCDMALNKPKWSVTPDPSRYLLSPCSICFPKTQLEDLYPLTETLCLTRINKGIAIESAYKWHEKVDSHIHWLSFLHVRN